MSHKQNYTIRRAVKEDCSRILELVRQLADYEKAPEQVTASVEDFEKAGFGPTPIWWAFVVEINGHICGFALYYIRFSTWKGCRLYLEDFYVEPQYRGAGAGSALFEALIQETQRRQLNGMVWQVLDWNEPAISFYHRYGAAFDEQWINCSLEIKH